MRNDDRLDAFLLPVLHLSAISIGSLAHVIRTEKSIFRISLLFSLCLCVSVVNPS